MYRKGPPIFLSTIIFTPGDKDATVHEIRRKIHEWVEMATGGTSYFTCVWYYYLLFIESKICLESESEEGLRQLRPRLLSAETVEIFSKDFTEEEIRNETENTFKPNRIGTMNQFLFMAFRIYFDCGYIGRHSRSKSISSGIHSYHKRNNCPVMWTPNMWHIASINFPHYHLPLDYC